MKCRKCKRVIEDNSIYCNWCGTRQIVDSTDVRVPPPRLKGFTYYNNIMVGDERVYISARTEEEYYAKAKAAKTRQIEIRKASPKMTLGKAIDKYIRDNDSVLSPSTINSYKSYRRTRFLGYLDRDLGTINYQRMINEESKKVTAKTVHNAWRLCTAAMRHVGMELPQVNLPRKVKADRPWLDYEQIQLFCKVLYGKPYELGALLALNGLRRSEILHLTSDDADTDNGIIHVRGASVVGLNNKLTDKATNKNQTSTRDVHIVIPRLNELIKGKEGRLVTTNPTTLYGSINDLCRANGLPEIGVHGLRHSYCSLAYHLKWSEATTMREGGWANTDTVHRVYTHLANQDADEDIKRMQQFFAT